MGTSKLPCKKSLALLIGLAAGLASVPASAAVFTVTKTDDTLDGACDLDCSLREAVAAANAAAGTGVIVLPEGRYLLTRTGTDEDQAATGDLDLRSDLVLLGGGALTTTIDGGLLDRVLDVPSGSHVEIQDVTVRGGRVAGNGGGIRALGDLALRRVTVTANEAASGFGGGLYFDGDNTLTVEAGAITLNTAAGGGGGVALGGTARFTNVTISGNRSLNDFGGGVYTFSDAEAVFANATITGNRAARLGGGLFAESSAFISVDRSELRNSILAGNTATQGDPDCSGAPVSGGYNLIGDGTNCLAFSPATHDLEGTQASPLDPRLGALGNNGGPTPTHVPAANSPALNGGNPAPAGGGTACAATDQRGASRQGFGAEEAPTRCDIGAFEVTGHCVTGGPDLCLDGGRFKVNLAWRTAQGQSGPGQAVNLTDQTGYFWFFSPENVEVTVKTLDACSPPFNSFWVFLSGLTDVEATVTVTDTATGRVKTYANPLGRRFRPTFDTAAFPCN